MEPPDYPVHTLTLRDPKCSKEIRTWLKQSGIKPLKNSADLTNRNNRYYVLGRITKDGPYDLVLYSDQVLMQFKLAYHDLIAERKSIYGIFPNLTQYRYQNEVQLTVYHVVAKRKVWALDPNKARQVAMSDMQDWEMVDVQMIE